ncbi:MAG: class I SAM-dependent methyltransferase [Bacilli bacterium]
MRIVQKAQELILTSSERRIAVDATCGNGHDTLFLLKHFSEVYAFDIQPLAIKRTGEKTAGFKKLHLLQEDFRNIKNHVKNADAIMFNLGFLPGSDRKIKTSDHDSAEAIIRALGILNTGGVMTIACYTQHAGGMEEFLIIKARLEAENIPFELEEGFPGREILIAIKKQPSI